MAPDPPTSPRSWCKGGNTFGTQLLHQKGFLQIRYCVSLSISLPRKNVFKPESTACNWFSYYSGRMNSRIVSVISASRTSFTSSHPWKSAPSMASKDAVELRSLSYVSPTTEANPDVADATVGANKSTVDKDTDPQTLLRNELENFAEGQGRRIALHVDSGANVKQRYDDGTVGVKLTVLHVLFDAFSKSSEDDETKRRSCAECESPAYSSSRKNVSSLLQPSKHFSISVPILRHVIITIALSCKRLSRIYALLTSWRFFCRPIGT